MRVDEAGDDRVPSRVDHARALAAMRRDVRRFADGRELAVIAMDNTNEVQVASSFDDFLAKYLDDPEAIAYCWR